MKRFWKSKINRRLVKSAGKLAVFALLLVSLANIDKIRSTNSAFMDNETSAGNTMTGGYWVPPTITVAIPAGGEAWQAGSSQNIQWSAASADPAATAGMEIDIDYSCDLGLHWYTVVHNTANDGTQSWTVPGDISENCMVRIGAEDSHGLSSSVLSNVFEISYMVVLNEFLPNPVGGESAEHGPKPACEWIELYNNGDKNIDVAGWNLYDAIDSHVLPITTANTDTGNTIIPAHGWLVVYQNGDADFSLNNSSPGDTLRLLDGTVFSGHLIDSYSYPSTVEGKTYARVPDGVGNWVDPVPTPGEKNTSSNDEKDFQKYYREVCFDKNDQPRCDLKFLKSIGLIDDKFQIVELEPVAAEAVPVDPDIVDTADEEIILENSTVFSVSAEGDSATVSDSTESTEENASPKVISKEFSISLAGKLEVPDEFLAEAEQKMKKIELSGEKKVISDLKDFEIDLEKIRIDKAGKIEILVSDLDISKDIELVEAKKDDVIAVISVSEKPKDEPKKDEKVSENTDAVVPGKGEIKIEEKKDDSGSGGDGSGGDGSAPKGIDSATP